MPLSVPTTKVKVLSLKLKSSRPVLDDVLISVIQNYRFCHFPIVSDFNWVLCIIVIKEFLIPTIIILYSWDVHSLQRNNAGRKYLLSTFVNEQSVVSQDEVPRDLFTSLMPNFIKLSMLHHMRAFWNVSFGFNRFVLFGVRFAFLRTTRRAISRMFLLLPWLCVVGCHCWPNRGATWSHNDLRRRFSLA